LKPIKIKNQLPKDDSLRLALPANWSKLSIEQMASYIASVRRSTATLFSRLIDEDHFFKFIS
jgi:hypothetical protein